MRLLILGGTSEGRRLAERLAGDRRFTITLSLAGRTASPRTLPVPVRVGGFGGIKGLQSWIELEGVDAVVDATHPFATQISANAVEAVGARGIPLGSIVRPAWVREAGDDWIEVASARAGVAALPDRACRVFLSLGRLELSGFAGRPEHSYLARTIDPPGDIALPPDITFVHEQGPFAFEDELAILKKHGINIVVSKNSGGSATYAKIEAARALGLPVVMIARPLKPTGIVLETIEAAVSWLDGISCCHGDPRSERGV